ncbi:uncharacterized protein RAG0_01953 [Rhynchosporium agropyri]|uniref:Uncharacterized protein n=1 Tax=Rhynchosporium agropyri TaxID=914238 RepID=A0A1E1K017_9HELO|nr:uncharacterized protein RAG0_01953 [Rhynchosporium agropyri]
MLRAEVDHGQDIPPKWRVAMFACDKSHAERQICVRKYQSQHGDRATDAKWSITDETEKYRSTLLLLQRTFATSINQIDRRESNDGAYTNCVMFSDYISSSRQTPSTGPLIIDLLSRLKFRDQSKEELSLDSPTSRAKNLALAFTEEKPSRYYVTSNFCSGNKYLEHLLEFKSNYNLDLDLADSPSPITHLPSPE